MRKITILYLGSCVLFIASLVLGALLLPEEVASHFGSTGQPDGWSSRSSYLVGMAAIGLLCLAVVPALGAFTARHPGRYVNIGNRDYWSRPEHRDMFTSKYTALIFGISAGAGLMLTMVNLYIVRVNRAPAPSASAFSGGWAALIVVVGFVIAAFLYWRIGRRPAG